MPYDRELYLAIYNRVDDLIEQDVGGQSDVESQIRAEYSDSKKSLEIALRRLNSRRNLNIEVAEKPIDDDSDRFVRVARDDEIGSFRPIRRINHPDSMAELWLASSAHASLLMFIKFGRENEDVKRLLGSSAIFAEFQILKAFSHPNVVHVYDVGWVKRDEKEFPFIATEYLDGVNLREWMEHNQPPSPKLAAEIVRVVANAVSELHAFAAKETSDRANGNTLEQLILHLDIKPSNIMVVGGVEATPNEKTLRIVDFGSGGTEATATAMGTPGFSAPERYMSSSKRPAPEPTWDIFALGALLYYLLKGTPPPSADQTSHEEWSRWLNSSDLEDDDLTRIIKKTMAYNASKRYQTAKQFAEDLQAWLTFHPIPHARQNDYSWYEKEGLLIKRCRETDDLKSHTDLISRTALLIAAVLFVSTLHFYATSNDSMNPLDGFITKSHVVNSTCLGILVVSAFLSGWRRMSFRIYSPIAGVVFSIIIMFWGILPSVPGANPDGTEAAKFLPFAMMILGVANLNTGVAIKDYRFLEYWGWFLLLVATPVTIVLSRKPWFPYYLPFTLDAVEILGLILFVFFVTVRADELSVEFTSGIDRR